MKGLDLALVGAFLFGYACGFLAWMFLGWMRMNKSSVIEATPWEQSSYDPDVEVRWCHGRIESRLKPKESTQP